MRQNFSKNSINLILAMVFGVVWAFFWAVDQMVTYLLFGLAVFFVALYFYNRKIEADEKEAQHTMRSRAGFDSTQENKTRTSRRPIFMEKTSSSNHFLGW
jgi:Na+/H+ antiporter NhaD/arsenite permease-like protein